MVLNLMLQFNRTYLFLWCHKAVLMHWLGLGTTATWSGLGKQHVCGLVYLVLVATNTA